MGIIVRCFCAACVYRNFHCQAFCAVSRINRFRRRRIGVRAVFRHHVYAGGLNGRCRRVFFCGGAAFNEKSRHGKMEAIQKQMKTNGFFYIFILRILPVNFDVISYAAGLSKVRPMTYFLATAAGIIPGTIVLNVLGASFMSGNVLTVLGVMCLYIVFLSLPVIFKKKVRHLFGGES